MKQILVSKTKESKEDQKRTWTYLYQAKPWSDLDNEEKRWLMETTQGSDEVMLWGHEVSKEALVDEAATYYISKRKLPETTFFTYCGYFNRIIDEDKEEAMPVAHA